MPRPWPLAMTGSRQAPRPRPGPPPPRRPSTRPSRAPAPDGGPARSAARSRDRLRAGYAAAGRPAGRRWPPAAWPPAGRRPSPGSLAGCSLARCSLPGCVCPAAARAGAAGVSRAPKRASRRRPRTPGRGARAAASAERLVHPGADLRGLMLGPGPLGDRPEQLRMVELLQAAGAPAASGARPPRIDHRRAVEMRRGDGADAVGHPGPGGQHGQPGARVSRAMASAANTAVCSCRTSTMRIGGSP